VTAAPASTINQDQLGARFESRARGCPSAGFIGAAAASSSSSSSFARSLGAGWLAARVTWRQLGEKSTKRADKNSPASQLNLSSSAAGARDNQAAPAGAHLTRPPINYRPEEEAAPSWRPKDGMEMWWPLVRSYFN